MKKEKTPEQNKEAVERNKKWRLANPEKYKEQSRKSTLNRDKTKKKSWSNRYNNSEKGKQVRENYLDTYHKSLTYRYSLILKGAKIRNLTCDLTIELYDELYFNKPCMYCGTITAGIDRVDNSKGYVDGNMVSCCKLCNRMKHADSIDDFINQVMLIHQHLGLTR